MKLPKKLRRLTPYLPNEVPCRVRLDANESFLPPPPWLAQKIAEAVAAVPLHRYPDPAAREVRALAAALWGVRPSQVVAGNGSDELISLLIQTLVPRGGRLLISDPDFSMYAFYAQLSEAECVKVPKIDRKPDICSLYKKYREGGADLIIFSNPCNPTGLGLEVTDVLALCKIVTCPVVVDEAYMDFWDQSMLSRLDSRPNLILLKTCSKAYGLAALRLGFAVASEKLASLLMAAKSPFNVSALTQAAGAAVLREPDYLRGCTEAVRQSKDALEAQAKAFAQSHPGVFEVLETHTNFVLLQTPRAPDWFQALLTRGVAVRLLPPNLLRVTAGAPEEHAALFAAWEELV